MKCPFCNREIGKAEKCPHCYAAIPVPKESNKENKKNGK